MTKHVLPRKLLLIPARWSSAGKPSDGRTDLSCETLCTKSFNADLKELQITLWMRYLLGQTWLTVGPTLKNWEGEEEFLPLSFQGPLWTAQKSATYQDGVSASILIFFGWCGGDSRRLEIRVLFYRIISYGSFVPFETSLCRFRHVTRDPYREEGCKRFRLFWIFLLVKHGVEQGYLCWQPGPHRLFQWCISDLGLSTFISSKLTFNILSF